MPGYLKTLTPEEKRKIAQAGQKASCEAKKFSRFCVDLIKKDPEKLRYYKEQYEQHLKNDGEHSAVQ